MDSVEALLAELGWAIGEATRQVVNWLHDGFVVSWTTSDAFRTGVCWGFGFAAVIGWFARTVLFLRARVLRYFEPIQEPATKPGPSPSQTAGGCRLALVQLFVLMALFVGVAYLVFLAFFGAP